MKRGKAKVKWDDVCVPKMEGGLGIKRMKHWNCALISSHVWRVLSNKESLWVKWIHTHRLAVQQFWETQARVNDCWSWRKMLQIRPLLRPFIVYEIGDGKTASAWFDSWCNIGPLIDFISLSTIIDAGFELNEKVADIINNSTWRLPLTWLTQFPQFGAANIPILNDSHDRLVWKKENTSRSFSVRLAWESLRPSRDKVSWYSIVWFSQCVPRHAFLVWLLMGEKLKTQDKLKAWEIHSRMSLLCPFCKNCIETHDHLFFECSYTKQVWLKMVAKTCISNITHWRSFVTVFTPLARRNTVNIVVAKLVFAASVYHTWQERNTRIFKKVQKSEEELVEEIVTTVRYKLLSINFKDSIQVARMKDEWKI